MVEVDNPRAFSYRQGELLAKSLNKAGVDYLFIGKSGAIILGYPDTTQDVDIYPRKDPENGKRIVKVLSRLGFNLGEKTRNAIIQGKDFVQIKSGPFDIDLVFAPDGLENYDEVKARSLKVRQFPVADIKDIIRSKEAAKRDQDLRDLPFLKEFARTLQKGKRGE